MKKAKITNTNRRRDSSQHARQGRGESLPATTRLPRVAVIVETSTSFGRQLLSGIAQYLRETRPWSVHITDRSVNDATPPWIESWKGDGIITRIASPEIRDAMLDKCIPVVDLNEQLGGMGVSQISNDHVAIGKMAAGHLFRHYDAGAWQA